MRQIRRGGVSPKEQLRRRRISIGVKRQRANEVKANALAAIFQNPRKSKAVRDAAYAKFKKIPGKVTIWAR